MQVKFDLIFMKKKVFFFLVQLKHFIFKHFWILINIHLQLQKKSKTKLENNDKIYLQWYAIVKFVYLQFFHILSTWTQTKLIFNIPQKTKWYTNKFYLIMWEPSWFKFAHFHFNDFEMCVLLLLFLEFGIM